eukprot:COSAG02_NODE_6060_length_3833_cov_12.625603_4_plen_144_part_00
MALQNCARQSQIGCDHATSNRQLLGGEYPTSLRHRNSQRNKLPVHKNQTSRSRQLQRRGVREGPGVSQPNDRLTYCHREPVIVCGRDGRTCIGGWACERMQSESAPRWAISISPGKIRSTASQQAQLQHWWVVACTVCECTVH